MLTLLVILAVIAVIPAAIAQSKGRSFFLWWAYGVGLWIFALIHSLVLKLPGDNYGCRSSDNYGCR